MGGLDQGRVIWPNMWKEQPWDKYDIGFLPGNSWAKDGDRVVNLKKRELNMEYLMLDGLNLIFY